MFSSIFHVEVITSQTLDVILHHSALYVIIYTYAKWL